jgi:hypothetical protein
MLNGDDIKRVFERMRTGGISLSEIGRSALFEYQAKLRAIDHSNRSFNLDEFERFERHTRRGMSAVLKVADVVTRLVGKVAGIMANEDLCDDYYDDSQAIRRRSSTLRTDVLGQRRTKGNES